MSNPSWQETQQGLGMPAARDLQQSILFAQLEVHRINERKRSGREVIHTVFDEKGITSGEMLLTLVIAATTLVVAFGLFVFVWAHVPANAFGGF